jgi:predicted subunit of tRNA(5-methylaminomethyl-2-thiouridylate) methyltransferase
MPSPGETRFLYRVEVSTVLYVLAENDRTAEKLGLEHAAAELRKPMVSEATKKSLADDHWAHSIPYAYPRVIEPCYRFVEVR